MRRASRAEGAVSFAALVWVDGRRISCDPPGRADGDEGGRGVEDPGGAAEEIGACDVREPSRGAGRLRPAAQLAIEERRIQERRGEQFRGGEEPRGDVEGRERVDEAEVARRAGV